jgi:hypothetical protein
MNTLDPKTIGGGCPARKQIYGNQVGSGKTEVSCRAGSHLEIASSPSRLGGSCSDLSRFRLDRWPEANRSERVQRDSPSPELVFSTRPSVPGCSSRHTNTMGALAESDQTR